MFLSRRWCQGAAQAHNTYYTRLKEFRVWDDELGTVLDKSFMHISVYFILVLSHPHFCQNEIKKIKNLKLIRSDEIIMGIC